MNQAKIDAARMEALTRDTALLDLGDLLSELVEIADAAHALAAEVGKNARSAQEVLPSVSFGPWKGLEWVMNELRAKANLSLAAIERIR
ncbi:MAG: hypothetical protein ACM33T_06305 [Solirubrobacterales bacterium]